MTLLESIDTQLEKTKNDLNQAIELSRTLPESHHNKMIYQRLAAIHGAIEHAQRFLQMPAPKL